ncbi:Coq4-domain-containing protein [Aureobasidium subglaciale]|nr:Coq4-domain-containing protein [Aureobasidium subglaciale]KAI5276565.1 Coq4-domain-containing protein [Aureobasidium subglaciale]
MPPTSTLRIQARSFSVLNRPKPNYPGHVPLTFVERCGLAVGSALGSMLDHHRHGTFSQSKLARPPSTLTRPDLVAALGEATCKPYFITRLRQSMLSHPTGRRILRDRPRISSKTMSLEHLRTLPDNSVGRVYAQWLDREGVTPDTRDQVRYIDDPEEAYVMQRYRESHDFYHALTGLPVFAEGEIALKAFEFTNTLLPMTALSMAAVVKLKPAARRRFWSTYLPWAVKNGLRAEDVINIYWEEVLEKDCGQLRQELGIEMPPDLREQRKIMRDKKKAEQASREARQTVGQGLMSN